MRGDIQDVPTVAGLLLGSSGGASAAAGTDPWATSSHLLRISDVANVTDTYETQRVFAYSNGIPCVTLDIQKNAGTSEVETSKRVLAELPALRRPTGRAVLGARRPVDLHRAAADRRDAHADRGDRLHRDRDAVLLALVA